MKADLQTLLAKKDLLELELKSTIIRYEAQIKQVESELESLAANSKNEVSEIDEPQSPWNIEHEGLIRSTGEDIVHLFEREQVFENLHE